VLTPYNDTDPGTSVGKSRPLSDGCVRLRAFRPGDVEFLYSLIANPEVGLTWRTRGAVSSIDDFRIGLWTRAHVQLMVDAVSSGETLGCVSSYNVNLRNGIGYVAALGGSRALNRGLVPRGLALLISYLFDNWPFRKLYFEASSSSLSKFASGMGRYFVEEGRLRDYEYWRGEYRDFVICAISRESWIDATDALDLLSRNLEPATIETEATLNLDTFVELMCSKLGVSLPSDAPEHPLDTLDLDSLHIAEILYLVEDLSGKPLKRVDLQLTPQTTLRDLFLAYCTLLSMP
jgi:RimJ/RimL family protein N-acetyltransferase